MMKTMNKAARSSTTTAMTEYYDEITPNAAEIAMEMAEIEAMEMALAEAMDAAIAAIFEQQTTA